MALQLRNETYCLTSGAGIQHYSEMRTCRRHSHDFIEFVYMMRGRSTHTIDSKTYQIKHGDMLVINYGQKHSIDGGNGEYINIFLKPEYINESLTDQNNAFALLELAEFSDFRKTLGSIRNLVTFTELERITVENIILNLEIELKDMPVGCGLSAHSWFNLLLVLIFRKMSLLQQDSFDGVSEELLEYLKGHCCEKLEMTKIASLCHYNPSYFSRVFKSFVGISFTDYIKKARVERAMLLLGNTGMRIHDICYEVGYTDTTRFFKDFKAITGVTPSVYRRNMIP